MKANKKIITALMIAALGSSGKAFATVENNNVTDSVRLSDIVVTGTRTATTARNLSATITVVGQDALTEQQRVNILPTLTEMVPGLFVTSRGMMGYGVSGGAAGGINIRGLQAGTGQLLVLIDGHPQYQGVYGHSVADAYQTMNAERVEVMRGPASVLYGSNAMGGVVNIITKGMQRDGIQTHVNIGGGSWGTFQGEAGTEVKSGHVSATISGNYQRTDNHRPNMGFEQYGGFAKVGVKLTNNWDAFVHSDVTHWNAQHPGTVGKQNEMLEAKQWITRGAVSAGATNHYGKTDGRISVYHNWGLHTINDGYKKVGGTPQTDYFRSSDALTGVSAYQSANVWEGATATFGIDYQHIYGHAYYTDIKTGDVVETPKRKMQSANKEMDEVAEYADLRQDIGKWLTLNAGVRYDWHSVTGGEWVPQFGIVARPIESAEIKATASKGFRNPSVKDMYLYAVANDELMPERIWNYELAWRQRLFDGQLTYGVNLFIVKGDNMIQTALVTLPDNSTKNMNVNTGEISNKGAELEAEWRINNHWYVTTNHSLLSMKNHILGAPEYKGFAGARMHYGKWHATIGIQQINGLYIVVNAKDTSKEEKTDFTLVNASASYQIAKPVTLWVKGENLLAQKYEVIKGMPMPRATVMAGVNLKF